MERLIHFALTQRFFTLLLALMIAAAGLVAAVRLPKIGRAHV